MIGKNSLFQTFNRAKQVYNSKFQIPLPPPSEFIVTSDSNKIILTWTNNTESSPLF